MAGKLTGKLDKPNIFAINTLLYTRYKCGLNISLRIKTNGSEKLWSVSVQFSCAARVNYAGVTTEFVYSMSSYFVGIKTWAVSLLSLLRWHSLLLQMFLQLYSALKRSRVNIFDAQFRAHRKKKSI